MFYIEYMKKPQYLQSKHIIRPGAESKKYKEVHAARENVLKSDLSAVEKYQVDILLYISLCGIKTAVDVNKLSVFHNIVFKNPKNALRIYTQKMIKGVEKLPSELKLLRHMENMSWIQYKKKIDTHNETNITPLKNLLNQQIGIQTVFINKSKRIVGKLPKKFPKPNIINRNNASKHSSDNRNISERMP